MEAATLFVVSTVLGHRAGGLMIATGVKNDLDLLCRTAVEGVRQLIQLDRVQIPE